MTDKQREILELVHDKLTEHFDGFCYTVEISDVDDTGNSETRGGYGGGLSLALGLATRQVDRLTKKAADIHETEDDTEE